MTDHLTEYFPMTEKVLARTARDWKSIILSANAHPDSTASENPAPALPSRFSTSTEGSAPLPSRFSTSTEGSAQPHTSYDEDAEDAEDEDEEEDPDEDGMLNASDESDDETGMGKKPHGLKWIKGALIGTGSFGQVYLGMDGSTGLLMAVKQVELPTGSTANQEHQKLKLSALEREIELLKDLQHEKIVQYLYSLLDDKYLNVFLEYIPGGSVAALLRSYGAFEEPLVRDFVRQILEGLNYLHERDIIHCDINGANILVDNMGGIKICSFGISKESEIVIC